MSNLIRDITARPCAYCGEECEFVRGLDLIPCCDAPSCDRELREDEKEEAATRRWEAERDDYSRYAR